MKIHVIANRAFRNEKINPYNSRLYTSLRSVGVLAKEHVWRQLWMEGDIFHVHWPEHLIVRKNFLAIYLEVAIKILLLAILKLRGIKILWTVHNLKPHQKNPPLALKLFMRFFISQVDGCIFLSTSSLNSALEIYPSISSKYLCQIPHGHYRQDYPDNLTKNAARAKLAIDQDSFVLLFHGQIKPYKNVSALIETFLQVKSQQNLTLLVVGAPTDQKLADELVARAKGDTRIRFFFRQIESSEVACFQKACDLVVLPYTQITNSGSAILSLSMSRPVLVPNLGSLPEWQRDLGADWIQIYDGRLNSDILNSAISWSAAKKDEHFEFPDSWNWHKIAQKTADFYHILISKDQIATKD